MTSDKDKTTSNRQTSEKKTLLRNLLKLEFREFWWGLLDQWEGSRVFRLSVLVSGGLLMLGLAAWLWLYPHWARHNALRMARQWIDAGQLGYAAEVVQKAIEADPRRAELWSMAAELAQRGGQRQMEVQYRHEAYAVQPGEPRLALEWASAALQANLLLEAEDALRAVPMDIKSGSAFAQRLQGELYRRENRIREAKESFEVAIRLEGTTPANELPLALCLLASKEPAERSKGLGLLEKLAGDRDWSASALRVLLADASAQGNRQAMAKWAEALCKSPQCTIGDVPDCLSALGKADPAKYGEVISKLKRDHLASPDAAAQLIGWLNQIGRSSEALEWIQTLPAANVERPPLAVAKAEALRCLANWDELRTWTRRTDWGKAVNFVRWSYAMRAARALGDSTLESESWRTLSEHAKTNSAHAYFAGTTIFTWGLEKEAEQLWWQAASAGNNISVEALGTLARFYQVKRDAQGQYKVFNQMHALRPGDDAVANNLAFFAALTGNREQAAEQIARANAGRHPDQSVYQATYAFVLVLRGQPQRAIEVLERFKGEAGRSPAVTLAYGLALAGVGQRAPARELLEKLDPSTLTEREIQIIKTSLGD